MDEKSETDGKGSDLCRHLRREGKVRTWTHEMEHQNAARCDRGSVDGDKTATSERTMAPDE